MRFFLVSLLAFSLSLSGYGGMIHDSTDISIRKQKLSEGIRTLLLENKARQFMLGKSKQGRSIDAYYFPGTSDQRALVIGGMHGSELSSIEVSRSLIAQLSAGITNFYSVIIIPSLFPDNAAAAIANSSAIGSVLNIGRYSYTGAVDPNRQMPSPGKALDYEEAKDHAGRLIEKENKLLLHLIDLFRPSRIASLHAIRQSNYGGVYADPRTDHENKALGYESDSALAISIAAHINQNGGNVAGNHLDKRPTALYYKDPPPVCKGLMQKRNFTGSQLQAQKGSGVSMGTWGTTAVRDAKDPKKNRDAMRVLTIEFPGSKRPADYLTDKEQRFWQQQVDVFANAIRDIFLGEHFIEDKTLLS